MRAPAFWQRGPSWQATALTPAAALVACVARRRAGRPATYRSRLPVVCIGNLVVGGSGKTPAVRCIAAGLAQRGWAPIVLSRGYGGSETGPLQVDPDRHDAAAIGDEPLLHAADGRPVWVARDRVAAARAIEGQGEGRAVILMDDGFQNPALAKTVSILAIDGATGFGNGKVLPAGPLREPTASGLARADAAILLGEDATGATAALGALPIFPASLDPLADPALSPGLSVVAFAGIARPDRFRATLKRMGLVVKAFRGFPDHHRFRRGELDALLATPDTLAVTTEKDWVRLLPEQRARVHGLKVRMQIDGFARLLDLIEHRIAVHAA